MQNIRTQTLVGGAIPVVGEVVKGIGKLLRKGAGIATGGANVGYGSIYEGTAGTLGKPVYVTDSVGLDMDTGVAVLGLTMDAVKVTESENREFISEMVSGGENIKYRIQAEGSFMLNVKGYSYKGTANPTVAALGTSTNWELKATDVKASAGVLLNVA